MGEVQTNRVLFVFSFSFGSSVVKLMTFLHIAGSLQKKSICLKFMGVDASSWKKFKRVCFPNFDDAMQ